MSKDQTAQGDQVSGLDHRLFDGEILNSLGIEGRTMLLEPCPEPWLVESLDLGEISLQRFREGGANIFEGAADSDRVQFFVSLPSPAPIHAMGAELDDRTMVVSRPGDSVASHSWGISNYFCLSVPVENLRRVAANHEPGLAGRILSGSPVLAATRSGTMRASNVVARAFEVGGRLPGRSMARRALADELLESFVTTAASRYSVGSRVGRPRISRRRIASGVREYLGNPDLRPWTVPGMVSFIGVSARFLRQAVGEVFGVSPRRLIQVRQVHDVRAHLLNAEPRETVSTVTAEYGIWEIGRFARRYRQVFGETPSTTLVAARRRS